MFGVNAFAALCGFSSTMSGNGIVINLDENGIYNCGEENDSKPIPHIGGFSDPEYDAIIEKAYKETDKNKRAELLHEAEALLMKDMPITPLVQLQNGYTSNSDLSGVKTNYYGAFMFTKAVLKNRDKYEEPEETRAAA